MGDPKLSINQIALRLGEAAINPIEAKMPYGFGEEKLKKPVVTWPTSKMPDVQMLGNDADRLPAKSYLEKVRDLWNESSLKTGVDNTLSRVRSGAELVWNTIKSPFISDGNAKPTNNVVTPLVTAKSQDRISPVPDASLSLEIPDSALKKDEKADPSKIAEATLLSPSDAPNKSTSLLLTPREHEIMKTLADLKVDPMDLARAQKLARESHSGIVHPKTKVEADAVRALEKLEGLKETGDIGPKVRAHLRSFVPEIKGLQEKLGVHIDGTIGAETMTAMKKSMAIVGSGQKAGADVDPFHGRPHYGGPH